MRGGLAALARGPGVLALAGVAVNGANLVVNVLLGRLLPGTDYGQSVVLVNVFLVAAIPGTALQVAVVRVIGSSARSASGRGPDLARLRRIAWAVTAGVGVLGLVLSRPAAHLLSLSSPAGLEWVLLAAGVWLVLSVDRALLQAAGSYPQLAANYAVEGGLRVVVSVLAGLLGAGGDSLAVGILASVIGAEIVLVLTGVRSSGGSRPTRAASGVLVETWTAFAALAPLAVLQNLDVIVVGHLAPGQVGPYAAVATAAKVPVFLGVAVGNYLLAEAVNAGDRRRALGPLLASAACVVAPAALLLVIALVAPHQLLALVYGTRLSTAAQALAPLTLAMTCLALTMLGSYYLLGVGRRGVVVLLVIAAAATPVVVALGGGQPVATSWWLLACQGSVAVVVAVMVLGPRDAPDAEKRPSRYLPSSWARSIR